MESKIQSEKLQKIKILVMDVDGTLTDGKVFYSKDGEAMKKFSIRDGMGIELLKKGDIQAAILTAENSQIVSARAKKLRIEHIILGSRNKKKDLEELAEKLLIKMENIAYIGDDVNDIQAMQCAGFSACPFDSAKSVLDISDYVCNNKGGDGAVRELAELILQSQNKSVTLPETW